MPLESSITKSIQQLAKRLGWYPIKYHGNQFTIAGIPDLICFRGSHAAFLEVKQPNKHPTKLQTYRMEEIERETECPCYVVRSKADAEQALNDAWKTFKDKP
jgi:hypothetical protein